MNIFDLDFLLYCAQLKGNVFGGEDCSPAFCKLLWQCQNISGCRGPRFRAGSEAETTVCRLHCTLLGSVCGGERSCEFQRQKSQRSGTIQKKKKEKNGIFIKGIHFTISKLVENLYGW